MADQDMNQDFVINLTNIVIALGVTTMVTSAYKGYCDS